MKKMWKRFWTRTKRQSGGFTLVELIVVIAILAILAGVAVPVYNGYIDKANRAADEQLLAVVNRAYAAACLENGQDALVTRGYAKLNGEVGSKKVEKITSFYDDDGADFARYYEDNEESVFKVFTHLIWKNGVFVAEESQSFTFEDKDYTYQLSDLQAYVDSNFYKIGVDETLGLMDNLVNMLANFSADGNPIESLLKPNANGEDNEFKKFLAENGFESDVNSQVATGLVFYASEKLSNVDPNEIAAAMTGDPNDDLKAMYCIVSGKSNPDEATFAEKAVAAATMYALSASFANDEKYDPEDKIATPDGTHQVGSLGTMLGYLGGCYNQPGYKDYLASEQMVTDVAGFIGVLRTLETNDENAVDVFKENGYQFAEGDYLFSDLITDGFLAQVPSE